MKPELIFQISGALLLGLGVFLALINARRNFLPGKRLGTLVASILTIIQWGVPAGIVFFYGMASIQFVWGDAAKTAALISASIGLSGYLITSSLIKNTFLPKGHVILFHSLVPAFSQEQRKIISLHEAGHLILHACLSPSAMPKSLEARITNGFRGVAGYVRSHASSQTMLFPSREYLTWECLMLLAGDLSTEAFCGTRYAGASSDMNAWSDTSYRLLVNGLTDYPFPTTNAASSNQICWASYQKLLKDHRETVSAFLSLNRHLIFEISDSLQVTGKLSKSECLHFLKQAKGVELLPQITPDLCPRSTRKIR
jgi:hypothetical protein